MSSLINFRKEQAKRFILKTLTKEQIIDLFPGFIDAMDASKVLIFEEELRKILRQPSLRHGKPHRQSS